MKAVCPDCRATIPAEDVNLQTLFAKCRVCNAVFDISTQMNRVHQKSPTPFTATPAGFKVQDDNNDLRITWRWFTPALFFLLFFCIAWDGFLVFWYSMALGAAVFGASPVAWIMVVFPVAHVAVGVGLTYAVIAGFLNRTTVRVVDGYLTVRHGPVPWRGKVTVPTDELVQFYCTTGSNRSSEGRTTHWHDLHAVRMDGSALVLLKRLEKREQALFLEYTLETYLGLPDHPVVGETPK